VLKQEMRGIVETRHEDDDCETKWREEKKVEEEKQEMKGRRLKEGGNKREKRCGSEVTGTITLTVTVNHDHGSI